MVHRPNTDTSVHARIDTLTAKHSELARAVARGTTALRDPNGNVLTLAGGLVPVLTTDASPAGLSFGDSSLDVVQADGITPAPVTAGAITASGAVSGATFVGTYVLSSGNVHADGDMFGTNGYFSGTVSAGGTVLTSDERLKERFQPVEDSMVDKLLTAPVQRWRWKQRQTWDRTTEEWRWERPDELEHVGPVAQDVPEAMQVEGPDGHLGIDTTSFLGGLLALCQRQQTQIDALTARLDALTPTPSPKKAAP